MELALGEWCVRSLREDDAPALARHANNAKVAGQLRDRFPHPYTLADAVAWIEWARGDTRELAFAIAERAPGAGAGAGEAFGGIGLQFQEDVHRRSAELGYWIGERYWGRGIATRAVRAFSAWAFREFPDLFRIYAHVFEVNPASARVLEKAGYRLEGTMRKSVTKEGRLLDQWMYGRLRTDSPEPEREIP